MNAPEPNALERHCRLLLRAYPARYRRERGEEILGTVLERVPVRSNWPPPAKRAGSSWAACARAAQSRREGTAVDLRQAALLGVVLALSPQVARSLAVFTFPRSGSAWLAGSITIESMLFFGLVVAAVTITWLWRPWAGAVLGLAAAPAWYLIEQGASTGQRWPVIIGLGVFALPAWGTNRPPRSWLLLPVAVIVLKLAVYAANVTYPQTSLELALQSAASAGFWVIIGAVALWSAVDARPALAAALAVACAYAPTEMRNGWPWTPGDAWTLLWPSVTAFGLAVIATWRIWRHQARI